MILPLAGCNTAREIYWAGARYDWEMADSIRGSKTGGARNIAKPDPAPYCYRTLGRVDCYDAPLEDAETRRVAPDDRVADSYKPVDPRVPPPASVFTVPNPVPITEEPKGW